MKKLLLRDINKRTGISVKTLSRWCRDGKFESAEKITTDTNQYWEISEDEWNAFEAGMDEVKVGRPKKKD